MPPKFRLDGKPKNEENNILKTENLESKEKFKELGCYPIFRANDHYSDLFPEIEPLFKKGEQPNGNKVLAEILSHSDKEIVIDETCKQALYSLNGENIDKNVFSEDLGEYMKGYQFGYRLMCFLKEKRNIKIKDKTIDNILIETLAHDGVMSPEMAKDLVSILKIQNPKCDRVLLFVDMIRSHISPYPNSLRKEKINEIRKIVDDSNLKKELDKIFENSKYFTKDEKDILKDKYPPDEEDKTFLEEIRQRENETKDEAKYIVVCISDSIEKELGIKPEFILGYDGNGLEKIQNLDENVSIIADRHNKICDVNFVSEKQKVILPLDTAVYHAEKNGVDINSLYKEHLLSSRRLFEKKEEKTTE